MLKDIKRLEVYLYVTPARPTATFSFFGLACSMASPASAGTVLLTYHWLSLRHCLIWDCMATFSDAQKANSCSFINVTWRDFFPFSIFKTCRLGEGWDSFGTIDCITSFRNLFFVCFRWPSRVSYTPRILYTRRRHP